MDRNQCCEANLLPIFLVDQYVRDLQGDRVDSDPLEYQSAALDYAWVYPIGLGLLCGRGFRRYAFAPVGVCRGRSEGRRVLAVLLCVADGQCWLLGDTVAQYSGLQPLRLLAT